MNTRIIEGVPCRFVSRLDYAKTGQTFQIFVDPRHLRKLAKRLLATEDYFLEDVTAIDAAEGFAITYHFDGYVSQGRVAIRCLVPHDKPVAPTISDIFHGANWHERETRDFYGIEFTGHDNLIPLLLPADADFHPLLKDDKTRTPLKKLIDQGEVIHCEPDFDLFAEEEEKAEEKAEA